MRSAVLIVLVVLLGCKVTQRVKFDFYDGMNKSKIIFHIPKGAKKTESIAGGREGSVILYRYPDSSVIYISDATGLATPNDSILRARQVGIYDLLPDTTLEGTIGARYYRDIKWKRLSYGYSLVSQNRKSDFDSVLNSVKMK